MAIKALLCELLFACLLAAPGPRTPDELAYRQMLFAYYQNDYTGALVETLVAEARGTLGEDPTRFLLARGSLAFAEGLGRMSDQAFGSLSADSLNEIDRMRLAFHRSRAYYRDGDLVSMAAELEQIRFETGWFGRERQHPEVAFMRAEAAIGTGDFAAAEQHLAAIPEADEHLGYGLFNLAVAERAAGDTAGAHRALDRLARLPLESVAGVDLVQRGRLAWALLSGETGALLEAQELLERLPAEGRYRDQALAIYGDLAMGRGDYRLAARIWLTLLQNDGWNAGRARAEVGLPLSLEALQAPERALGAWHQAANRFEARLASLHELSALTANAGWAAGLLAAHLPTDSKPRAEPPPGLADSFGTDAWLAWLARDDVSRLIGEWRDLHEMHAELDALPARLAALQEVKQERRRRSAQARSALADRSLEARRHALAERIERLNTAFTALAAPGRPLDDELAHALATPPARALLERLTTLETGLAQSAPAAESAELERRLQRLRGLVLWEIAEARSARTRELALELRAARTLLVEVDARIARLARAEADLEAGIAVDFRQFRDRSERLTRAVAAQMEHREAALAAAFRDAVQEELQRVDEYLLTARIAIARTTDRLAAAAVPEVPES